MAFSELLLVLVGLSLIAVESSAISIEPKESLLLYRKGSSVTLKCETVTQETSTSLQWTAPTGYTTQKSEQFNGTFNHLVVTLKISSFDSAQAGDYVCEHLKKDDTSLGKETRTLKIVTETKEDYHFMDGNTTARLSCQIDLPNIVDVKWLQNTTYIADLKNSETHFKEENTTLIINKPERKQAGLYIARFTISGRQDAYDCEVYFTAAPFVEDFEKAKNLIQDDNMELQCKVQGYPPAVVTWYKDNVPLNVTAQGDRIVMSPLMGYQNARLQIKNVQFEDAGEYRCEAYSKLFNLSSHKDVTVRVKDKLAALWPFLGIVGEVVILCTIIFIYEKRRNKQAEQEELNAQEADDAISDKKEGLRHRNTTSNNPTA